MYAVSKGVCPVGTSTFPVHSILHLDPCLDLLLVGAENTVHVAFEEVLSNYSVEDKGHHGGVENEDPLSSLAVDLPAQALELLVVRGLDPAQELHHALRNPTGITNKSFC